MSLWARGRVPTHTDLHRSCTDWTEELGPSVGPSTSLRLYCVPSPGSDPPPLTREPQINLLFPHLTRNPGPRPRVLTSIKSHHSGRHLVNFFLILT